MLLARQYGRTEMKDAAKRIIGAVAPTAATMLGGPLAGMAVRELSTKLLGTPEGGEAEIEKLLLSGNPEAMVKLREVEADLTKKLKELDIDLERIHAQDRASARQRAVDMNDWTPTVLGVIVIAGYFVTQYQLLQGIDIPAANMPLIMRALGILDAMVLAAVYYFFGSSAGSKEKDHAIEDMMKRK